MKLLNYLAAVAVLASVGCRSATIEVPGYATVRGLSDTSYHFKQPYFKFRGLFYGQEPTNLTRFLVSNRTSTVDWQSLRLRVFFSTFSLRFRSDPFLTSSTMRPTYLICVHKPSVVKTASPLTFTPEGYNYIQTI